MNKTSFLNTLLYSTFLLSVSACSGLPTREASSETATRCPAQSEEASSVRLVPQESYGDEVLNLLDRRSQDGIMILQFNFFTDNRENSYPKQIAQRLTEIRKQHPRAPITVALESKKDKNDPKGKGAAQRNATTKARLMASGIDVRDVFGHARESQTPPGREDGVSHTKLVMAGDEIIAGSNNLTKQSTDVGANNEMNVAVRSVKIANAVQDYVNKVIASPGQMVDIEVEDGDVRLLTDRLHFDELLAQIRLAKKGDQLGLSMYQFLYRSENDRQARQVFDELIAAHRRGARLEIFLNRAEDQSTQNTSANLRVAEALMQEGVSKVYFDPEGKISHSKFFYRVSGTEKVSMISSVNIYRGDFNDNHQMTWVIRDPSFTDQLMGYFKHQIAYDGTLLERIPRDLRTGLRYKIVSQNPEKTTWNPPNPPLRMLRFWRGFKQDGTTRADFESRVNARLIPETIEVGAQRGLNAYLPSFFSDDKPDFLPDEVAIVDYANEETYNAIRTTERGRKYGPLHFEPGLFAKENGKGFRSGSLVAVKYEDSVEIVPEARAYILGAPDLNWQEGVSTRRTLLPVAELTAAETRLYLSELQSRLADLGINGVVAIVDPRYLILMINSKDVGSARLLDSSLGNLERGRVKKFDHIVFENQNHGATHLPSGRGVNVRFEAKIKPRTEIIDAVLTEIRSGASLGRCERLFR